MSNITLPKTINAARFHAAAETTGDFGNINVESVPLPELKDGEVLVRVSVAAVNPVDWKVHGGHLVGAGWALPLPFTVGYDFAGTVAAVGPKAEGTFSEGDAVFAVNWGTGKHDDGVSTTGGALAQFIAIPASKLSRVPEGVSPKEAAAVSLVGTTAHEVLFHHFGAKEGDKVLVLGGAGAVGALAVQLAKNRGLWVATTASTRNVERVRSLGADLVIDYTATDWSGEESLAGIDYVFDTVGEKDGFERAKKILKSDGGFASIASFDVGFDPAGHPPLKFASFVCLHNDPAVQDDLVSLIAAKKLKVDFEAEFPFTTEGVRAAMTKQFEGKSNGKIVVKIE